jgi:hypothetical protein
MKCHTSEEAVMHSPLLFSRPTLLHVIPPEAHVFVSVFVVASCCSLSSFQVCRKMCRYGGNA